MGVRVCGWGCECGPPHADRCLPAVLALGPLVIDEKDVAVALHEDEVKEPRRLEEEAAVDEGEDHPVVVVLVVVVLDGRQQHVHRVLHLEEHKPVGAEAQREGEKE